MLAAAIVFPETPDMADPVPRADSDEDFVAGRCHRIFFDARNRCDNVSHVTHLAARCGFILYFAEACSCTERATNFSTGATPRQAKFEVYSADHKNEPPGSSDDRW